MVPAQHAEFSLQVDETTPDCADPATVNGAIDRDEAGELPQPRAVVGRRHGESAERKPPRRIRDRLCSGERWRQRSVKTPSWADLIAAVCPWTSRNSASRASRCA